MLLQERNSYRINCFLSMFKCLALRLFETSALKKKVNIYKYSVPKYC